MFTRSPVLACDRLMPKQPLQSDLSEFGMVLDEFLSERGWNQTQLSAETEPEVSQGQLSNYRYNRRRPKPETLAIIARALTPRIADQDEEERKYHRILNRLRHATGLRPVSGKSLIEEITYDLDPEALRVAEQYSGLPDYARRIVDNAMKSASELALEMDREGALGRRAE